jgi:Zn-finger nucleic acid-binding protein
MQMTCPKCHGDMRVYERSGVTVDQCTECRGIFLDRGELEKLFEAETNWNNQQSAQAAARPQQPAQGGYAPPPPPPGGGYAAPPPPAGGGYAPPPPPAGYPPAQGYPAAAPAYGQQQGGHQQGQYGYHGHYRQKKHKKSFLNELFD